MSEVVQKALLGKEASIRMAKLTSRQKNDALRAMAEALVRESASIIAANQEHLARGQQSGIGESLLDRLALDEKRIQGISEGLLQIIGLPDPVGDVLDQFERPNGLVVRKVSVPLGLIGIIYEARPNVTVDAAGLCLKSGNAVLLRGGSDALSSNIRIVEVLRAALATTVVPPEALQLITSSDRASVDEMLKLNGLLDVVIPRGGRMLIQTVVANATVPVIETGAGVCHTYLDETADPTIALNIAVNAKVQRPSVCNSMETLLLHEEFAEAYLPGIAETFRTLGVQLRGCPASIRIAGPMEEATDEDYATEYNDYILNVRIVESLDEALEHIRRFGTQHSECIVTEHPERADRFLQEVDAAAVYHNASTRFTDGFEFGYGAEIGISTQKLHARGPMGLPALTSTKFLVYGSGQIRG